MTQGMLPDGNADEVRERVRGRIRTLASGGGFVFAAVHDIQYGVPPQNIVAMADAALEYGTDPIEKEG